MMRKIVIGFLLFSCGLLFAQKENNGDVYRREGDLEKAIIAYKKKFKEDTSNYGNTYNLACAYAIMYQKDSAFHYLNIALKNHNSLWALADNDLLSLTDDDRWEHIENQQLKKYQEEKGELLKPAYAKQLLRIIMKDQALDYQLDMAKRFYMKNEKAPHWYYPLAKMKEKLGAGNFVEMEKLIKEKGWPTYQMVGKLAADGPLLVINHHKDDAVRVKYLPKIKEACLKKQGSCMEYAKIHDRILVNSNKPQLYGMQFRYNAMRKLEPFPIENPEYVDKRRKKIGLKPLKEYLKRKINYDWNVEQK